MAVFRRAALLEHRWRESWLLAPVLTLGGIAVGLYTSCGQNTDGDGDGFFNAPEVAGTYLYDCNDTDKEITSGLLFFRDKDEDGGGDRNAACFVCQKPGEDPPTSATFVEDAPCEVGTRYIANDDDCDDALAERREGIYYYRDADSDDFGDPNRDLALYICPVNGEDDPPDGFERNDYDCDDSDPRTGAGLFLYLDADGDGHGNSGIEFRTCGDPPKEGYVEISEANPADCNDESPLATPDNIYDCKDQQGLDDDCDGVFNEDDGRRWYKDDDKDGYGDAETSQVSCPPPEGWVSNASDCDDGDAGVYPGTPTCPIQ